jgi:ferredoxin--NADP+ reductase
VVSTGAQGTKKLGIAGEDCIGVYHAKDVVYHYNQLPPFSQQKFEIGNKVAIIGMGNVMVDIAHWLLRFKNVEEVFVVARRGPLEKAYDDKEFEYVQPFLDLEDMQKELDRIEPRLKAIGQNTKEFLEKLIKGKEEAPSNQRLKFRYLCSPSQVLASSDGKVAGLEVEENELVLTGGRTSPKGTGKSLQLEVDTVIYAIGDQVDPAIGIPSSRGYFITNPDELPGNPSPATYQVYDPDQKKVCEGIFLVGWSRNASVGLVGIAKQDAERGAKVVNEYLATRGGLSPEDISKKVEAFSNKLSEQGVSFVSKDDVERLEAVEKEEARNRKIQEYKFSGDDEMLSIVANDAEGGAKAVKSK